MNSKLALKVIILSMLMALLIPFCVSCASSAEQVSALTLKGYIMDTHCFLKKPDPALDSKKCLQMAGCAATGYGIAVIQPDSTYKFYVFNGSFAPEATETQLLAASLINQTTKTDHISIKVIGTLSGGTTKSDNGTEFQIINVESLVENNE